MDVGRGVADLRREWYRSQLLVLLPLALIVAISTLDLVIASDIHLGPLLVVAPAITASFAGTRLTAAIGALAVVAQVIIGVFHGGLWTANHQAQIAALVAITVVIVLYCRARDRRGRELLRVRSVSEAVQRVLLRPLPDRLGPFRLSAVYLAAEDEANVGGDLYAAVRVGGATRLLIGDVRGKGLEAVGDAALLLGAFRELAHHHEELPALARGLERSYDRHLAELIESGEDAVERFVTALLIDLPDAEPVVRITSCGHPPPLLLHRGRVSTLDTEQPAPPLGLGDLPDIAYQPMTFGYQPGDVLVLYTDGITEARNRDLAFYPLAERIAAQTGAGPDGLLHGLRLDLLHYVGGRLRDDAALVAVERAA